MIPHLPDLLRGKWVSDLRPGAHINLVPDVSRVRRAMAFEAAVYQLGSTDFSTTQILDRYLEEVAA